jgi:RNA polymerase sigma-70 factor, ECF subfamily
LTRPAQDSVGALLGQIASGVQDALVELYARTASDVLAAIAALVVDRHQAEEVRQEVYLQLWLTAAAVFDPAKGSGRAFVMAVARRRAIDRIRAVESARRRDSNWDRPDNEVQDFSDALLSQVQIQSALHALGERAHTIVAVYYHGRSYMEIAHHLGVPVATVKTRHHRALAALRRLIQ